jgi:hypothetical protein
MPPKSSKDGINKLHLIPITEDMSLEKTIYKLMTTNQDSLIKICNDITEAHKFCIRLNIIKITIEKYIKDKMYYTEYY